MYTRFYRNLQRPTSDVSIATFEKIWIANYENGKLDKWNMMAPLIFRAHPFYFWNAADIWINDIMKLFRTLTNLKARSIYFKFIFYFGDMDLIVRYGNMTGCWSCSGTLSTHDQPRNALRDASVEALRRVDGSSDRTSPRLPTGAQLQHCLKCEQRRQSCVKLLVLTLRTSSWLV